MSPGSYVIGAQVTSVSGLMTNTSGQQQPRAQTIVDVVNADVENLILTITPPVSVSGRLSVEGQPLSANPFLDRLRVNLAPPPNTMPIGPGTFSEAQGVNEQGEFKIENLMPGDYRVSVSSMPIGYYIKSVRLEQIESSDHEVRVAFSTSGPLDITLGPNGGRVDGVLVDDKQQAIIGTPVVLIPEQQRNRFDLYKTANSDQNGRFVFSGITPGDYKIFSWEALEQFAYYDPDLMRTYEAKGKLINVSESSNQTVQVNVIPAPEP